MKVALVYPYIVPKADEFRPAFQRFVKSHVQFSEGTDHCLWVQMCNGRYFKSSDGEFIEETSCYLGEYNGEGMDIGAHQHAANSLPDDYDFAVFCSSQVYFHRQGWLKRMVEAREAHGPGLYGAMASFEHRPHLRTCFFGCDPKDFRSWPWVINSREMSLEFESGKTGFWSWMKANGRTQALVTWDDVITNPEDWRKVPNGFRNGDQSNCLVWDKHTLAYAEASPEEKLRLEASANGL